jgi:phosphoglycolate phosphatase
VARNSSPLRGATIAFDLDGTLVDTAPDLIGALNVVLAECGLPALPLEAARIVAGRGARAMVARGFEAEGLTVPPEREPALFDRFIEIYVGRIARESRPFPGVVAALDALEDAGARLAVCTNKRSDLTRMLLDALDLTPRFAAIVGPDTAGFFKPDPRHLLKTIEAAGGRPDRALMVGDAVTDREAAAAAGMPVVLVSFGYSDPPAAALAPDALIDHFDELPATVRRLLAGAPAAISPSLPGKADA